MSHPRASPDISFSLQSGLCGLWSFQPPRALSVWVCRVALLGHSQNKVTSSAVGFHKLPVTCWEIQILEAPCLLSLQIQLFPLSDCRYHCLFWHSLVKQRPKFNVLTSQLRKAETNTLAGPISHLLGQIPHCFNSEQIFESSVSWS